MVSFNSLELSFSIKNLSNLAQEMGSLKIISGCGSDIDKASEFKGKIKRRNIPISKYSDSTIRTFRRGRLAQLGLIKKISKFLVKKDYIKFNLTNLQKNISLLGVRSTNRRILNPKFPFDFNTKEGAIIIPMVFHDGGITTRDLETFYCNLSFKLRRRYKEAIEGVIGKVPCKERRNLEVGYPKIVGLILTSLGLIPGKRQINNPKFPLFVFNYPEDLVLEFLAQAIADDGWISNPKKGSGYISFNLTVDLTRFSKEKRQDIKKNKLLEYLPNNLLGNINLFKKLGCKVAGPHFGNEKLYVREGKEFRYTQEWRFQVRGYKNFRYLAQNLKIPLKYKQEKLLNEDSKIRMRKI